jgi:hypothetical protein
MSHLAFDEDGEPIDLPSVATGWRVKRMKATRGAPGLVYGGDGAPLVLPLDADIEDLRREVGTPGRYRLEALDERRRVLDDVKAAVVIIPPSESTASDTAMAAPSSERELGREAPNAMAVVMEALRQNSEMARTIVDRFPAMLEASAVLLKAADGAGLPKREPCGAGSEDGDEDDDQAEAHGAQSAPGAAWDLNAIVAHLAPVLLTAMSKGDVKLPNFAEMLDWRRAASKKPGPDQAQAPKAQAARPAAGGASSTKARTDAKAGPKESSEAPSETAAAPTPPATAPTDAATETELPPLSPQVMAHFLAIQSALTPEEAALARAAAAELSPHDLRAWFEQLSAMSIPDAAKRVRGLLAASLATPGKPEVAA